MTDIENESAVPTAETEKSVQIQQQEAAAPATTRKKLHERETKDFTLDTPADPAQALSELGAARVRVAEDKGRAGAADTPVPTLFAGDLIIPDACVPFIRYQRSRYSEQKEPDPEVVKRRYAQHVLEDFENMKPFLPPSDKVKRILEIGCGVGTLNVHLQRHYPNARVSLLDGDSITRQGGAGYAAKSDIYNSREITQLMLTANGCKVDQWHDIGTQQLLEADLIVSLASMGYHYPLSNYRLRGTVICDLRRGAEKKRGQVIYEGPKYDRCLFTL